MPSIGQCPFNRVIQPPPPAAAGPNADIAALSMTTIGECIRTRDISCRELAEAYLARIEVLGDHDHINAFLTVDSVLTLREADRLDGLLRAGRYLGPLHGIPLGIKDALDSAGMRTTGGTRVLSKWIPERDATVVGRLRDAGAIIVGKTNLHEAGFGITSNNPHYGPVRNPYDPARIPGGSSGGTAAAVAAGLCVAGLGTDTGGSVRIPAALCGCVGLKPTLGRVSTGGMMGLSWTCDVNGPMTRSVADAALLLRTMANGPDPRDPVACASPLGDDLASTIDLREDAGALRNLRVGVPGGYFTDDNEPSVTRCLEDVKKILSRNGAEIVDVVVENMDVATAAGFAIVVPEAVISTEGYWRRVDPNLASENQLEELGPDVRSVFAGERGATAQPVPAHVYLNALRDTREAVRGGFENGLNGVDVLLTPTTPAPAVPISEHIEMLFNGRPVDTFATFIRYTFCVSLAGLPAISVPAGQTDNGLPIGVQFIGRPWSEAMLIETARAYELAVTD